MRSRPSLATSVRSKDGCGGPGSTRGRRCRSMTRAAPPHREGGGRQAQASTLCPNAPRFLGGCHECSARCAGPRVPAAACETFSPTPYGVWHPDSSGCFFFVRPAWAHSCGCKSRRKLITANEVKRNCARVTERGEEAWSISCEPMDKNRIEGAAEQGERAQNREALVIKAKWRRSGGCAVKECVLTWGDLASCLKGRR